MTPSQRNSRRDKVAAFFFFFFGWVLPEVEVMTLVGKIIISDYILKFN